MGGSCRPAHVVAGSTDIALIRPPFGHRKRASEHTGSSADSSTVGVASKVASSVLPAGRVRQHLPGHWVFGLDADQSRGRGGKPTNRCQDPQRAACNGSATDFSAAATDLQRSNPRTPTNTHDPAPRRARIYWPNRLCSCGCVLHEPIGAPGFEPGTSPTRTVRATRLRHAPMRRQYSTPLSFAAGMPAASDRHPGRARRACSSPRASRTTAPTACRCPGARGGRRRSPPASRPTLELFELRRGRARRAAARPPRPLLGLRPAADRRALKRRLKILFDADMRARRLPPAARRAPRSSATTRCSRGRSAPTSCEPFALHRGQPIGFLAQLPGDGLAAEELFARVPRSPRASRSSSTPARRASQRGDRLGRRLRLPRRRGARRRPRAAHRRAGRARDGRRRASAAALDRRRPLRDRDLRRRALGEHLAERFGVRHVFLDVPNPI